MGFNLGNLLKGAGKVASIAAPFIPGVGGLIAGALGGLSSGGQAQGKADQVSGQLSGIANTQTGLYNKYAPLISQQLLGYGGYNPETGGFDPQNNPFSHLANNLYDSNSITGRANDLFNPSQLNSQIIANREGTDSMFQNAINATKSDLLNRGFQSPNNSILGSNVARIRGTQAQSNANFQNNLFGNLLQQKQQYIAGQQGLGQGLQREGLEQGQNVLASALPGFLSAGANAGVGTLGGLQGMYNDQSKVANEGVGGALGSIAQTGILDKLLKKKKATSAPVPPFVPRQTLGVGNGGGGLNQPTVTNPFK